MRDETGAVKTQDWTILLTSSVPTHLHAEVKNCIEFVLRDPYWTSEGSKITNPEIRVSCRVDPTRDVPCNGQYNFNNGIIDVELDFSGKYFPSIRFGSVPVHTPFGGEYGFVRRDFEYLDWQEACVAVTAHELQHMVQDFHNKAGFGRIICASYLDYFLADYAKARVDIEIDAIEVEELFLYRWREYKNDLG